MSFLFIIYNVLGMAAQKSHSQHDKALKKTHWTR